VPDYFEPDSNQPFDPVTLVTDCIASGASSLLLDVNVFPPEFFDLSTGLAGELVRKLGMYQVRMAGVVPDVGVHSTSFQEFVIEANRGVQFRFFSDRSSAIQWLASD
jgi:hypothetical protein